MPNDFASPKALAVRLFFDEHYRQIARPFEWTFSRQDSTRYSLRSTATNRSSLSPRDCLTTIASTGGPIRRR
jgi:hypothetical protein